MLQIKISDSQDFLAFTLSELQEHSRAVVREIKTGIWAIDKVNQEAWTLTCISPRNRAGGRPAGEEVDALQDVQCIEWFNDDKTVLYTQSDSGLRPFRVGNLLGKPNRWHYKYENSHGTFDSAASVASYWKPHAKVDSFRGVVLQVCRHSLGRPQADDEVVLEEERENCFVSLTKTKDGCLIVINSNSKTSSEVCAPAV